MIDSAANENAGAFEMRMVGQKSATSRTRDGIEEAVLADDLRKVLTLSDQLT